MFSDPPQLEVSSVKKEGVGSNSEGSKLPDDYLSTSHEFSNQDPDELMINDESHKESENIENGKLQDDSSSVKV